jgi:DNA repair ATPase RecN
MDPVLRTLLLERLASAELDAEAKRVIEVACDAGEVPSDRSAPPVWLRSVTVEGFRGIGAPATLALEPSPGLTVVVGRNGSGKSSFAEGLELLMTGRLKRWEKRPKAWTETWQCLHHTAPTRIAAELVLEGDADVTLAQEWAHGVAYDDATGRAAAAQVLGEHGWDRDLPSFRPFLSYAELATMFDTLSSLYEALTPVLGLADIDELAGRLAALRLEAEDLGGELRRYAESLEAEPGRLQEVEERLEAYERLERKHGGSVAAVLAHAERCRAERDRLERAEVETAAAEAEHAVARTELERLTARLGAARRKAAPELAARVREELCALAMEGAAFEVAVEAREEPGPAGAERVELMLAPNPGVPAAPIREAASGGELSRVMLALMTIAGTGESRTLVFDEVDAGVGGQTARAVGERLRALAEDRQVLCITHLPQIAALAGSHFRIEKQATGRTALTTVEALAGEGVLAELVRMLGAEEADGAARRHAQELLAAA